jgi:hypothetical protein
MRIQTPYKFHRFGYFGLDTSARVRDELLAFGIGRFYCGIYPTRTGFDLSVGILDQNGCLD